MSCQSFYFQRSSLDFIIATFDKKKDVGIDFDGSASGPFVSFFDPI